VGKAKLRPNARDLEQQHRREYCYNGLCTKDTVANLKSWRQSVWSFSHRVFLTLESVMPDCPERPQCLRSARFGL